jgi:tetratricopeptide (TPR) repeat protein
MESKAKSENERNRLLMIFLLRASMFLLAGILILIEALLYYLYLNPSIKTRQERDLIYYTASLKKNPENPDNYFRLAMTYLKAGDEKQGKYYLNLGRKLFPNDYRFPLQLTFLFYQQKQFESAAQMARETLKINPNCSDAYFFLGKIAADQNQLNTATEMFAKALALDPYNADLYLELGKIYEKKKLYEQAQKLYHKGLQYNPYDEKIKEALERITTSDKR